MSHARWTLPNCTWSYSLGYVSSSLWLSFTIRGNLCAHLRLIAPRTPNVEANALQPPSTARRMRFSGSK